MPNLNVVHLMGNLTRDPELRVTPTGSAVCQFGLAINHTWFDERANEKREETTFVDVTAWGRQAETIAKYVTKGRPLYVQGRLKLDQWEDKATGQKRSKLSVVLSSFQFLGGRDGGDGYQGDAPADYDQVPGEESPAPPARHAPPARSLPQRNHQPAPQPDNLDEDVPF